jgi:acetyltransferase
VRSELKGSGLGEQLMHKLIRTLREQGTQRLFATVLVENQRMLELAKSLGFTFLPRRPGTGTHEIELAL